MAAITGHDANIEFASGYTVNAFAWRIESTSQIIETTLFAAPDTTVWTREGVKSWSGQYRCRVPTTVATAVNTFAYYAPNVYAFSFEFQARTVRTTPFAANTHTYSSGILTASGSYSCYMDDRKALPVSGERDILKVTIVDGVTFTIPIVVERAEANISADGEYRHVDVTWRNSNDFSDDSPVIGFLGDAVFTATIATDDTAARQYKGTILITRFAVSMNAARDAAEYKFDFVGTGDLSSA